MRTHVLPQAEPPAGEEQRSDLSLDHEILVRTGSLRRRLIFSQHLCAPTARQLQNRAPRAAKSAGKQVGDKV